MPENMIDRVARIMAYMRHGSAQVEAPDLVWGVCWKAYVPEALEVIKTMREPTEAMAKSVGGTLPEESTYGWQAMIDAALAEA